jgi:hypothetical protein
MEKRGLIEGIITPPGLMVPKAKRGKLDSRKPEDQRKNLMCLG